MIKIGVLSDTHGLLRPEVMDQLQGCQAIFHGGDINKQKILDQLGEIAPVHVVRGNNDKEWAEYIPETLLEEVCGLRVFMVHNKRFIPKDLEGVDLVIYGHSHRYEDKMVDGVRYLNPGSCGPRRFHQEITMALLFVQDDGAYEIEKIVIPHPEPVKKQAESRLAASKTKEGKSFADLDLVKIIPAVMKDIDGGKTVKQIARKHKVPVDLAEDITRMYLTHPGVDVEGILRRIKG